MKAILFGDSLCGLYGVNSYPNHQNNLISHDIRLEGVHICVKSNTIIPQIMHKTVNMSAVRTAFNLCGIIKGLHLRA